MNHGICNNMDEPAGVMLSEVNQTKTNTVCFHSTVESKKWKYLKIVWLHGSCTGLVWVHSCDYIHTMRIFHMGQIYPFLTGSMREVSQIFTLGNWKNPGVKNNHSDSESWIPGSFLTLKLLHRKPPIVHQLPFKFLLFLIS